MLQNILHDKSKEGYGSTYKEDNGQVVSHILSNWGIDIYLYHKVDKKKIHHNRIYVSVNLYNVFNPKSRLRIFENTQENVTKLCNYFYCRMNTIFPEEYCHIDQYKLDRIDLTYDRQLSEDIKKMYLRFAKGGYTPAWFEKEYRFDEKAKRKKIDPHRIVHTGDSMQIIVYDKEYQLKNSGIDDYDASESTGYIRFEMPLKKKWIRRKVKEYEEKENRPISVTELFAILRKESGELFINNFDKIFQKGHYYI